MLKIVLGSGETFEGKLSKSGLIIDKGFLLRDVYKIEYVVASLDELQWIENLFKSGGLNNLTIPIINKVLRKDDTMIWFGDIAKTIIANLL